MATTPKQLTVSELLLVVDKRLNLLTHFDATGPNPVNYVRTNASFARTALYRAAERLGVVKLKRKRKGPIA
jgi:hypothetical protein